MNVPLPAADASSRARATYDFGSTAMFASKSDPRFHYCMYVPPEVGDGWWDLLVAVHSYSATSFLDFRDGFSPFGNWNCVAVLCPIFPIGPRGDGERNGYKYMAEGDIRYDKVLLSMVAEVAENYRQDWRRLPCSASPAAVTLPTGSPSCIPGAVGRLDRIAGVGDAARPDRDWWVGIRDLPERFGIAFDQAALARVPVQMLVGDADLETWEITHVPGGRYWMEGATTLAAPGRNGCAHCSSPLRRRE